MVLLKGFFLIFKNLNMKILTLIFIVLYFPVFSQKPVVEWAKTFGGSKTEFPYSIAVTKDNKYVIAGFTSSSDGDVTNLRGSSDAWLIKLNENGSIIWKKNYGGSGVQVFGSITQTLDEGYIIVGGTTSTNGDVTENKGGGDIWIVKIDSIGTIQWQKTIGGSKTEYAGSVFQTKNGDYIVGAYSSSSDFDFPQNSGERDWWVLKLNNQGTIIWKKRIGGSKSDTLLEIVNIDDKTFAITGTTDSEDGDMVGSKGDFSVKMDSSGNILWKKSFGSPLGIPIGLKELHTITVSKNEIVQAGMMIISQPRTNPSALPYSWDYWVTKLDTAGNLKWSKIFGGTDTDDATSIKAFPNGDLLVAGYTQSNDTIIKDNHGGLDFWVIRIDRSGNLKNADCYGGSENEQVYCSAIDKKGNVIVVGHSLSTNGTFTQNKGSYDWAILKLRYPGTSVKEPLLNEKAIVEFPNPLQDQFIVRISQNIAPNLTISNVLGKRMYQSKQLKSETTIDTSSFPNGMYILTYQFEGETFSRKIMKMQ